jgi:hypothetical protein
VAYSKNYTGFDDGVLMSNFHIENWCGSRIFFCIYDYGQILLVLTN